MVIFGIILANLLLRVGESPCYSHIPHCCLYTAPSPFVISFSRPRAGSLCNQVVALCSFTRGAVFLSLNLHPSVLGESAQPLLYCCSAHTLSDPGYAALTSWVNSLRKKVSHSACWIKKPTRVRCFTRVSLDERA